MRLFGSMGGSADVRAGMRSDPGRVRDHNEDACLVDLDRGLFAVADGVGGQPAGDVAARITIDRLPEALDRALAEAPTRQDTAIERAVVELGDLVQAEARAVPEHEGMATTLVIVLIEGSIAHVAHVGDSRAYLARAGELRRLTDDHSLAAQLVESGVISADEASNHPFAHSITQAIGLPNALEPTVVPVELTAGDRLLLCTDGLTDMLSHEQISAILADAPEPDAACQQLVDEANAAGGRDNITVVVVDHAA